MKSEVGHESENKSSRHGHVNQAIQALEVEDCQ